MGGLYYAFNSLFYRAFDTPIPFTVKDLLYQISLGSDRFLCPQMWSQFDMMIITGIMWLVCRFFWPRRRAVLIGIAIAAIVFQYTGANMGLFGGLEYELRYPLGRIAEMLPFAVIGYLLSSEVCIAHIRKHGVPFITASFVVSLIILLQSTIVVATGFGYGGLGLVVLSCACFIICYCVPIPRRMPQALKDMIEFLSRYSFGVYCVHFGVGYYLNLYLRLRGLSQNTMTGCVFIYAVSIIVSWAIAKFPIRQCAGLVT